MQCWKMSPEDRPTFKELCSSVSKFIERIAGYLEIGFNPFTETTGGEEKEVSEEVKSEGKLCKEAHSPLYTGMTKVLPVIHVLGCEARQNSPFFPSELLKRKSFINMNICSFCEGTIIVL